ncbi:cyclic nucleotide-binding domain-containing protein [Sedimenticola hydrogenitrophicus]|uniref:cyclic nucleotide-binding domain-containing protein n=1 Tax=Sedimenticola hydrogenitrophicus TaxID=2967975 RepID=UPI0021A6D86F|nr:cyclic nucleotide-binding domain-containing protein [Sedimenticola hydrogenitrophicus]
MELDLNKFRTLIPVNALYEDNLLYLAEQAHVERYLHGEQVFNIGDNDPDSLFLMSGELCLTSPEGEEIRVSAGSDRGLHALASRKPRHYRGVVVSQAATVVRFDSALLERLLAWGHFSPEFSINSHPEPTGGPSAEESEWMMSMMQTTAFTRLPAANIQDLFSRMEEVEARAGDLIVKTGDPGDYYYVIKQGRCRVTLPSDTGEVVLAELGPCSSFGEEALITDSVRNANVSMLTNGKLMRLAKEDFLQLLEAPLLQWIDYPTLTRMAADGAVRIDVRFRREFEHNGLRGSLNIPQNQLRAAIPELDKSKKYIVYCDSGQRSATCAFLLSQQGFDVYVLEGGLSAIRS